MCERCSGGSFRANVYRDDSAEYAIDILRCDGTPAPGLTSYSTIGLHRVPNLLEGRDIRVELLGVASTDAELFPNVLATAAFNVMKDGWLAAPGVVFAGAVAEYQLSATLDHILLVPPFAFEDLGSVEVGDGIETHCLLAVPISSAERAFLQERGYDELEARFAEADVPYFDLGRPSVC